MSKIGSYNYPDRKIAEILEAIRLIKDKLKGNMASIETIALALGYKGVNNGAFQHKLNDLKKYGLIEGRGKEMGLSELAKTILAPHNKNEETAAYKEMVLKVPLWRDLYEKYGSSPSDLNIALSNLTGADRLAIEGIKENVGKLYIDAVSKISNDISNVKGRNMDIDTQYNEPKNKTAESVIRLEAIKYDVNLTFPAESDSIELIENTLKFLKKKLEKDEADPNKMKHGKKLLSDDSPK